MNYVFTLLITTCSFIYIAHTHFCPNK